MVRTDIKEEEERTMREVNEASIQAYCRYLIREEKSAATVIAYLRGE